MPDLIHAPASRLTRWAIWLALAAACLGLALEAIRASLGHRLRSEAVCAALIIVVIAAARLAQLYRRAR